MLEFRGCWSWRTKTFRELNGRLLAYTRLLPYDSGTQHSDLPFGVLLQTKILVSLPVYSFSNSHNDLSTLRCRDDVIQHRVLRSKNKWLRNGVTTSWRSDGEFNFLDRHASVCKVLPHNQLYIYFREIWRPAFREWREETANDLEDNLALFDPRRHSLRPHDLHL